MANGQFWILGIFICLVVSMIALIIIDQADEIHGLKKNNEILRNTLKTVLRKELR